MLPKQSVAFFAAAVIALTATAPLHASARLTFAIGDKVVPVAWPASAFPIPYQVDRRVMDSLPNAAAVIDRGFATWANAPGTSISFRNLGVADGLTAGNDGKNTITLADDLFKDQYAVAMTTNWYDSSGNLTEADIMIDSSLVNSNFNMQFAVTHEIGHFLGLDHSAVMTAIMYPYVPNGNDAPSLDSDDLIAIANIYPGTAPNAGGVLQGRVTGDDGGVFAAQVVAMNDQGQPVATALSDATGAFTLQSLPAGNYRLYAEPLDGPVAIGNLAGVWRSATVTSFPTHFCDSGTVHVENGKLYGNLVLNTSGAPIQLNPLWVGVASPGSGNFNLLSTAVTVQRGQSIDVALAGDGIVSGMTQFSVLNPGFTRTSAFQWAGNFVYATFSIAPDAPVGSVVILANSGTEEATLTGALRVQGPIGKSRLVR